MACPQRAMASGTSKPGRSSFGACATTSKAPSGQSEKPSCQSASPSASKAVDEPSTGHAFCPVGLRGRHRGGDRLACLLDGLLVLVCARKPPRSRLLQLLFGGQALSVARRVRRL